jgi:hypothetical protein
MRRESGQCLTRQDWFWLVFVALIGTIATFGGFIIFIPSYVLALVVAYLLTKKFPMIFNRNQYSFFVLKVLAVALPIFTALCLFEIWLMPSVFNSSVH